MSKFKEFYPEYADRESLIIYLIILFVGISCFIGGYESGKSSVIQEIKSPYTFSSEGLNNDTCRNK